MNDAKESDLEFTAGKEIFKYIKYIKEIRVIQSFVTPHILSKKKKNYFWKKVGFELYILFKVIVFNTIYSSTDGVEVIAYFSQKFFLNIISQIYLSNDST